MVLELGEPRREFNFKKRFSKAFRKGRTQARKDVTQSIKGFRKKIGRTPKGTSEELKRLKEQQKILKEQQKLQRLRTKQQITERKIQSRRTLQKAEQLGVQGGELGLSVPILGNTPRETKERLRPIKFF